MLRTKHASLWAPKCCPSTYLRLRNEYKHSYLIQGDAPTKPPTLIQADHLPFFECWWKERLGPLENQLCKLEILNNNARITSIRRALMIQLSLLSSAS